MSASELGSRRLLSTVADLVVNSPMLSASVVDEQSSLIRLTNGSTIRSVPASVKALKLLATSEVPPLMPTLGDPTITTPEEVAT